jgi:alpha/beta superfamily hydrolase
MPLVLLGFSFGGFVAASLAGRLESQGVALQQLFMLAPAVSRLTAEVPLPQAVALILIQPEQDEIIDPASVYAWSAACGCAHELLKVAECGHFFHGKLVELKDLVLPRLQCPPDIQTSDPQ